MFEHSFDSGIGQEQVFSISDKDILYSKVQIDHLVCGICLNVIWEPVSCSSNGCFSNFCSSCIDAWTDRIESDSPTQNRKKCPNCKRIFKKAQIPLIRSLLESLVIRCLYWKQGCSQRIKYKQYSSHIKNCEYKKRRCEGCKQKIIMKDFEDHLKECDMIMLECKKCNYSQMKGEFVVSHNEVNCFERQIENKDNRILNVQQEFDLINNRYNRLEGLMKKLMYGESLPLKIQFFTTFTQHFSFPEPTLIKPSFNSLKQKFDFLHFYIINPIKIQSPIGVQWKFKIKKLIGHMLIGFCNTMDPSSVDFILNKFGELKKKQSNESKYKLLRKTAFEFSQGDTISFKFNVNTLTLKIENETKNLVMKLDSKEILEIGPTIYSFYSMDNLNDSIAFL